LIPAVATENELERLWQSYTSRRDGRSREQLMLHYLSLVKQVAGRLKLGLPGSVEFNDLVGAGLMGLINSIDNFNPRQGFKFETYAVPRIRGAILDGLRDVDWLPRSYRQKSRRLDKVMAKLIGELGRVPHDHEVARELGLDEDEYQKFMDQVGAASMVSLDVSITTGEDGETGTLHEVISDKSRPDPLSQLEETDARDVTIKLIGELSEQERAVVALYYYEELTFREIGGLLGISESRVCQIHTRVISVLRARLREIME